MDLKKITSHFLNNYKTCPQIHLDACYFFVTIMNGDRSCEKAKSVKIQDIKQKVFSTVTDQEESILFDYIKRTNLDSKTGVSMGDVFGVVPKADETSVAQPYTVITVSLMFQSTIIL